MTVPYLCGRRTQPAGAVLAAGRTPAGSLSPAAWFSIFGCYWSPGKGQHETERKAMNTEQQKTGGCVCGAARYAVTGEPLSVHACHCTDCQALSGSAFGLSMVLHASDLQLNSGTVTENRFSTDHNTMHRHHCERCGTALWFSSPAYADIIALKPGTLDDTSGLRPIAHMWVRSAQPWLRLDDGLPVFDRQPSLEELLELAGRSAGSDQ